MLFILLSPDFMVGCAKVILFSVISIKFQKKMHCFTSFFYFYQWKSNYFEITYCPSSSFMMKNSGERVGWQH